MERARGDGKPHTAQDTLPFRQMFPDGLCKLDDNTWSKCIEFEDVNYQLAQPDQQTAIFEGLCDLYNSHDSSIGMEISLPCRHMNQEDFLRRIEIAAQGDAFDGIRQLYTQMLRRQLEKGNNGIVKTKLLVLTITESDIRAASGLCGKASIWILSPRTLPPTPWRQRTFSGTCRAGMSGCFWSHSWL